MLEQQCGLRAREGAPPEVPGDPLERGARQLHPPDRNRRGAHSNQASQQRKGRRMDPPRRQEIRLRDHLVNLTLWDELAHVSGQLVLDVVEGDNERRQVYYKVVVQQLNFIERSFPPALLYEPGTKSGASGAKLGNYLSKSSPSTEELWQVFFANPMDWWDDRKNKKNPKYPDFKHKHAGKALWVEANYNPPWVKSQLAILDSRMGSLQANGTSSSVSVMYSDDFAPF